jgi:hypothetical protein
LQNLCGILAVYRIDNSGRLKRLKRWPAALDPRPQAQVSHGSVCGSTDLGPTIKQTIDAFIRDAAERAEGGV